MDIKPTKLTIAGKFWDSQIYAGKLYLFGRNKEIWVVDWVRFLQRLTINANLRVVLHAAFLGNQLYGAGAYDLLNDPEIRDILVSKFNQLSGTDIQLNLSATSVVRKFNNPLPFPHSDSEMHYQRLYVSAKAGLYSVHAQTLTETQGRTSNEKHWDAPVLDIAASNGVVAAASGSEGLHEIPVGTSERRERVTFKKKPEQISKKHCSSCDWAFYSVFASSHVEAAFLADYSRQRNESAPTQQRFARHLERVVPEEELFQSFEPDVVDPDEWGYSWGGHDKIYRVHNQSIQVVRYNPNSTSSKYNARFHRLGEIELPSESGGVVTARVAPFGTVIECSDTLLVIPSSGDPITVGGAPVNWRVFPRSDNYTNQLHVIQDDCLTIWSFNHDYFVNQRSKLAGSRVFSSKHR